MNAHILLKVVFAQFAKLIVGIIVLTGYRPALDALMKDLFFHIAEGLHRHGISRHVGADMFDLQPRSYRKKIEQYISQKNHISSHSTLSYKVLKKIKTYKELPRQAILKEFSHHEESLIISILVDHQNNGYIAKENSGKRSTYKVLPEAQKKYLETQEERYLVYMHIPFNNKKINKAELEKTFDDIFTKENLMEHLNWLEFNKYIKKNQNNWKRNSAKIFNNVPTSNKDLSTCMSMHLRNVIDTLIEKINIKMNTKNECYNDSQIATWKFNLWKGHPYESTIQYIFEKHYQELDNLFKHCHEYTEHNKEQVPPESYVVNYQSSFSFTSYGEDKSIFNFV